MLLLFINSEFSLSRQYRKPFLLKHQVNRIIYLAYAQLFFNTMNINAHCINFTFQSFNHPAENHPITCTDGRLKCFDLFAWTMAELVDMFNVKFISGLLFIHKWKKSTLKHHQHSQKLYQVNVSKVKFIIQIYFPFVTFIRLVKILEHRILQIYSLLIRNWLNVLFILWYKIIFTVNLIVRLWDLFFENLLVSYLFLPCIQISLRNFFQRQVCSLVDRIIFLLILHELRFEKVQFFFLLKSLLYRALSLK